MKLLNLHVENFGMFRDRRFDLGEGGFQLVFGPNEAGKSTLLQLVRELLFGFPARNTFGKFDHAGEIAATATLRMADDRELTFRRRKGRVKTVVGQFEDDGQDSVDSVRLGQLLGGTGVELYQNVFGFSLAELSAGEKSLADAKLSEALYGGGIGGLANFQKVQRDVRDERESLYSPQAKKKVINSLLREIKNAEKQLSEDSVPPREYRQSETALAQRQGEAHALRQRLNELKREQSHWDRLAKALGPLLARRAAADELADLDVPAGFPADGAEEFRRAKGRLASIEEELNTVRSEINEVESQLAGLRLDPELIEREGDIKPLEREVGKIEGFLRDIPPRRQDSRAGKENTTTKLRSLNPEWGHEKLDEFQLSLPQREAVRQAGERSAELNLRREKLDIHHSDLHQRREQVRRQLEELDDAGPVDRLQALVDESNRVAGDDAARDDLSERVLAMGSEIDDLTRQLAGPIAGGEPAPEQLAELPVPLEATIQEHRQALAEREEAVGAAIRDVDAAEADLQRHEDELSQLDAERKIPDRTELLDQRGRRDLGWRLIRRKFIDDDSVDDDATADSEDPLDARVSDWLGETARTLPDRFETEVARADELADRRQEQSELAARRDQLIAAIERNRHRLARQRRALEEAEAERQRRHQRWLECWAACPFTPLSPEAMLKWRAIWIDWHDKRRQRESLQSRLNQIEQRLDDYHLRLREAIDDEELPIDEPGDSPTIETLLATARRRCESAATAAATRQRIDAELPELDTKLESIEKDRTALAEDRRAWHAAWRRTLEEMRFPNDWDCSLAGQVIAGIEEARLEYQGALLLDARIADMETETAEFEAAVRRLCEALDPGLLELPATEAIERLGRAAIEARQNAGEHETFTRQLERARQRETRLAEQMNSVRSQLESLRTAAGVETDGPFFEVAEVARRHGELAATVVQLDRDIRNIMGTEDESSFMSELERADADSIAERRREIQESVDRTDQQYLAASNEAALLSDRIGQIGRDSQAIETAGRLESLRAQLAQAVDRWAPLALAEVLMAQAVARFESRHQPEVLKEVARLLARLTHDRYVGLRRKLDTDGSLLIEQSDGTLKEPGQLSTGTREQLYLAIRLAYVTHYCRHAEPLPIVMDDVLVNFDDARARATLEVLGELARSVQIIFLTCHQATVELASCMLPDVTPVMLDGSSP